MFRQSTGRTFNGGINVAFVNITSYNILQQRPEPTARHTVFAFLISALFNFLQLQYQNTGTVSPFQTHPKTMSVALFSLLLYCIAYEVKPSFIQVGRGGMGLFGSILLISLASVLFHNSVSLALYFLYVVFSNREMLRLSIEVFRRWIHQRTVADPLREIRLINRRWTVMPPSGNRGGLLPL
ncbi:hypothetical protein RHGRI_020232 [Rhododendron griersonianum]|uniref:Uncharacterized protein n=1 Tax=Rhododendron griersonianum TaxID=479676 RepID=A0AAV6JIN1_9ERIC|nr:hypothetical protein RHGRI_020232 [Rhododendron griersonianum]